MSTNNFEDLSEHQGLESDQAPSMIVLNPNKPNEPQYVKHTSGGGFTANLEHLKNPMLPRNSRINCEFSEPGSHGHSGSATHFVQLAGVGREGSQAVCEKHARMLSTRAREKNDTEIKFSPISIRDVHPFKVLRAMQKATMNLAAESGLLFRGVPALDATVGREKLRLGPGAPEHRPKGSVPPAGYEPTKIIDVKNPDLQNMTLEEPTPYKKNDTPGRMTLPKKQQKPMGIGKPKAPIINEEGYPVEDVEGPRIPIGEGAGHSDHVMRLFKAGDPSWESEAERLGVDKSSITSPHIQEKPRRGFAKKGESNKARKGVFPLVQTSKPEMADRVGAYAQEIYQAKDAATAAEEAEAKRLRRINIMRSEFETGNKSSDPVRGENKDLEAEANRLLGE